MRSDFSLKNISGVSDLTSKMPCNYQHAHRQIPVEAYDRGVIQRRHLDLLSIPRVNGGKNVKTFRWDQRLQIQNL